MKVSVIGAGYVGLVAASCLSRSGHDVTCLEKDEQKLAKLQSGQLPFYEEGLEKILREGLARGTLRFNRRIADSRDPEIVMIAVGTPARTDRRVDLSQIYEVVSEIVEQAVSPLLIVNKSTVPPGFGVDLRDRFLGKSRVPLSYLANPEFLREGMGVWDWYHPERIVIGGEDKTSIARLTRLYSDIEAPVLEMDISSAEMVKYAANAFLATKISFINEIANLCELVGADIQPVARAVGMDRRIGGEFLQAGLGYGGSCFPKDTCGLDFVSTCNGYAFNLLKAVIEVNNRQRVLALRKLRQALGRLHDKTVGVLGLAFKPGTDDVRESPSLEIISLLQDEGARIRAYDPLAMHNARRCLPENVTLADGTLAAAAGCHALLVATAWPEFLKVDWDKVKALMRPPYVILDGRNCLPGEKLAGAGFHYLSVGRTAVSREVRETLTMVG